MIPFFKVGQCLFSKGSMMIIDSLTHVTPNGQWFSTSHDASEVRLLREMDEAGVDKAVFSRVPG